MDKIISLWKSHFGPALIAGLAVGIIFLLFSASPENILLFASLGASAAILAHPKYNARANVRVTIISYVLMSVIAIIMRYLALSFFVSVVLTIFLTAGLLSWLDLFHPPAISASLSFLLYSYDILSLLGLLASIVVLLLLVRLFAYILHPHLDLSIFHKELFGKH